MVNVGEIENVRQQQEPAPTATGTACPVFVCLEDDLERTTGLCGEYSRVQRQLAQPMADPIENPLPPIGETQQEWCTGYLNILRARRGAGARWIANAGHCSSSPRTRTARDGGSTANAGAASRAGPPRKRRKHRRRAAGKR